MLASFWKPLFIVFPSKIVPESENAILWKWASRVHEVLIFKDLGPQNPSKNRWKIDRKINHFFDHVGIKIASKNRLKNQWDFGSILEGFWLPNGPILGPEGYPKRDFWASVGVSFSAPLQGTPNGRNITPKWSQTCLKIEINLMKNS